MRYIAELERKLQTLQTEATSLSAQLTLVQVVVPSYDHFGGTLKLIVCSLSFQSIALDSCITCSLPIDTTLALFLD